MRDVMQGVLFRRPHAFSIPRTPLSTKLTGKTLTVLLTMPLTLTEHVIWLTNKLETLNDCVIW